MKVASNIMNESGFSLVEMAVVLMIMGLVLSGLIVPLSTQMDQKSYNETQDNLRELREALIGFAMVSTADDGKPYLPCPDTDGDGFENRDAAGACIKEIGAFPWATLGIGRYDAWSNGYLYRVTNVFANKKVGFTLSGQGNIDILEAAGGAAVASDVPAVILSKGKMGIGVGADEQENSNGNLTFVSHTPVATSDNNQFDDLVVWVPPAILCSRMVSAAKLP